MIVQFRSLWSAIKASYWFYPALFAICGFLLGSILIYLDRTGATEWLSAIEWFHPARPEGASNMLTVLAGSMIGVASTVFSITIAAVAYASGTYGPRLLTNFMEDKGNQLSLATFIGIFVYAITVLRTVRAQGEAALDTSAAMPPGFVPQLSLSVSFALMMVAVAVLVYFLHHIPASIRINSVLEGIGKRLIEKIGDRFPCEDKASKRQSEPPEGYPVEAAGTGYIRFIELDELARIAKKGGFVLGLTVRAGDFVHAGKAIARLDREELEERIEEKIRSCFALGGSRTSEQDIEFSIDELVEIALRALSPGINDPFTAITAVHWLGAATGELGRRWLCHEGADSEDLEHVVPLRDEFDHFVGRGFGAARSALASSKIAALVAFQAIYDAAARLDDAGRVAMLAREGDLLMAQAELAQDGPDLDEVRAGHASFVRDLAAVKRP